MAVELQKGFVPSVLIFRATCPHVGRRHEYLLRRNPEKSREKIRGCRFSVSGRCSLLAITCPIDSKMRSIEGFYENLPMVVAR